MTIIPAPGATPAVQTFVFNLTTLMASTPQVKPARAGEKRAAERLKAEAKAKRAWHKSADAARKDLPPSRQVRRHMERRDAKRLR